MKSAFLLALLAAAPATALDVSLEENRAERGSIGFVDLKRVFAAYPETQKAKRSFAEIVRQAEEQVNLRRAELMDLRAEIARLELERDMLKRAPAAAEPAPVPGGQQPGPVPVPGPSLVPGGTPPPAPSAPPAPPAPAPGTQEGQPSAPPEPPLAPEPQGSAAPPEPTIEPAPEEGKAPAEPGPASTATAEGLSALPGMSRPLSLEEKSAAPGKSEPLTINIPGMSEEPIVVAEPGAKASAAPEPAAPSAPPAPSGRLAQVEAELAAKRALLAEREEGFRAYQGSVEKNLIEIESRRSEILLGRVYKAVREVARENGVSVVVDKGQILFGQETVDLTPKVLQRLKELQL